MADKSPINPGKVEWSGENPGIYLRDEPEGPLDYTCSIRAYSSVPPR